MGIMYGVVALVASLIFGLPYVPLIAVSVAVLQTIPYFGPYVSWAPPVVAAVIFQPAATIPVLVIMLVAMVVLANLIQPELSGDAVGLSPLAVLVAVLVGGKLAGVLGGHLLRACGGRGGRHRASPLGRWSDCTCGNGGFGTGLRVGR